MLKIISQFFLQSMQKRAKNTNRTDGSQNRTVGSKSGLMVQAYRPTVHYSELSVRYFEPTVHQKKSLMLKKLYIYYRLRHYGHLKKDSRFFIFK